MLRSAGNGCAFTGPRWAEEEEDATFGAMITARTLAVP